MREAVAQCIDICVGAIKETAGAGWQQVYVQADEILLVHDVYLPPSIPYTCSVTNFSLPFGPDTCTITTTISMSITPTMMTILNYSGKNAV